MGTSIRALLIVLATFLTLSLALWNGCFGNRASLGSNASAASTPKETHK